MTSQEHSKLEASVGTIDVREKLEWAQTLVSEVAKGTVATQKLEYLSEAEQNLRACLNADSSNVAAHIELGNCLGCFGRFSEAMQSFRTAATLQINQTGTFSDGRMMAFLLVITEAASEKNPESIPADILRAQSSIAKANYAQALNEIQTYFNNCLLEQNVSPDMWALQLMRIAAIEAKQYGEYASCVEMLAARDLIDKTTDSANIAINGVDIWALADTAGAEETAGHTARGRFWTAAQEKSVRPINKTALNVSLPSRK